jgi:hypothetical protein
MSKKLKQSTKKELKHLQGKHRDLDKIIAHNEADSSPQSWQILKSLKKKKLYLKDRIMALKKSLSE